MANFRVGQKVVCVAESFSVKEGEIYTIDFQFEDGGVLLKEVESITWRKSFKPHRFKPLQLDHDFVEEVIKQVTPKEELA